jgi:hypothetical protein
VTPARARAWVAVVLGAAVALAMLAWPAHAETVGDQWTAAWTSPTDSPATFDAPTGVAGWFRYGPPQGQATSYVDDVKLTIVPSAGQALAAECPPSIEAEKTYGPPPFPSSSSSTTPTVPSDASTFQFTPVESTPPCNGTYVATAHAHAHTADPLADQTFDLQKTIVVTVAPAPVTSLTATADTSKAVTLKWAAPAGYPDAAPPDFGGYAVERGDAAGEFTALGATTPDVLTFKDAALPASGVVQYRIRAVRPGATEGSVTMSPASASVTRSVDVGALPAPTTTVPAATHTHTTIPDAPPTTVAVAPGDPITDDTEPGEADAVVPPGADELGAPVVHDLPASHGRALLTPIALGLLLLVWAMHLRFLTRQAARAA